MERHGQGRAGRRQWPGIPLWSHRAVTRPRRRRSGKPKSPPPVDLELRIDALGRHGDGIADHDGRRAFVPFALPGETVRARVAGERGTVLEVTRAAAERVAPFCPHFGVCGGCALQHLEAAAYDTWKRELVETVLSRAGLDAPVDGLVAAHGAGRRRVTLQVRFAKGRPVAGFLGRRSHDLLEIDACPVLAPALAEAPAVAAALAAPFSGGPRSLQVRLTAAESGLDVDIGAGVQMTYELQVGLAEAAEAADLARLTLDGEIVVERRRPAVVMGPARVIPDPGGFLQATEEGEAVLAGLVKTHLEGCARVADLFSGIGPFAFRLAEGRPVHGVDGNAAAVAALETAVRHTPHLKPVTTEVRNLFRAPLAADELNGFDGVVFDPPRAGAEAQARELAQSNVPVVVGVSCDPASFARDAAILVAGGYELVRVTPVDQFKYTAHVEVVGLFRR